MQQQDAQIQLYTISQTAKIVGVHSETIRRWTLTGQFPPPRHKTRGYKRYHRDDVLAFLNGTWKPAKS